MSVKNLAEFPLFSRLGKERCEELTAEGKVKKVGYKAGEIIESRGVYCVLSGKISVYSTNEEKPVLMRYLKSGDVFGVATLYSGATRPSRLVAENEVRTYVLSPEDADALLTGNAEFMRAYIAFLSDRIAFLSEKIGCIAAGSAEQTLSAWIATQSENGELELPVNMSDLARILDLSRASLYRAFDGLQSKGVIKKTGAHVRILRPKA